MSNQKGKDERSQIECRGILNMQGISHLLAAKAK